MLIPTQVTSSAIVLIAQPGCTPTARIPCNGQFAAPVATLSALRGSAVLIGIRKHVRLVEINLVRTSDCAVYSTGEFLRLGCDEAKATWEPATMRFDATSLHWQILIRSPKRGSYTVRARIRFVDNSVSRRFVAGQNVLRINAT